MKTLIASGAILSIAALSPALAAPEAAPIFNWTGFYIGGHLGGGWSDDSAKAALTGAGAFDPAVIGNNASGIVGGGQIGYNWQFTSNWLLGIEGDFSGTNIHAFGTAPFASGGIPYPPELHHEATRDINWLASIRGRLGYTSNHWLVYVTGGGAWGSINYRTNITLVVPLTPQSFDITSSGWVIGGGVEYAVTSNWTARVEYLHYDFGDTTVANVPAAAPNAALITTFNNKIDVVRAGVNYKF